MPNLQCLFSLSASSRKLQILQNKLQAKSDEKIDVLKNQVQAISQFELNAAVKVMSNSAVNSTPSENMNAQLQTENAETFDKPICRIERVDSIRSDSNLVFNASGPVPQLPNVSQTIYFRLKNSLLFTFWKYFQHAMMMPPGNLPMMQPHLMVRPGPRLTSTPNSLLRQHLTYRVQGPRMPQQHMMPSHQLPVPQYPSPQLNQMNMPMYQPPPQRPMMQQRPMMRMPPRIIYPRSVSPRGRAAVRNSYPNVARHSAPPRYPNPQTGPRPMAQQRGVAHPRMTNQRGGRVHNRPQAPPATQTSKPTSLIVLSDSDDEIEMIVYEKSTSTLTKTTNTSPAVAQKSNVTPTRTSTSVPQQVMQRMSQGGISITPLSKPRSAPAATPPPKVVVVVNETGSHYALVLPNGSKLILTPEQVAQIRASNGGKLSL